MNCSIIKGSFTVSSNPFYSSSILNTTQDSNWSVYFSTNYLIAIIYNWFFNNLYLCFRSNISTREITRSFKINFNWSRNFIISTRCISWLKRIPISKLTISWSFPCIRCSITINRSFIKSYCIYITFTNCCISWPSTNYRFLYKSHIYSRCTNGTSTSWTSF